eukprot:s1392_g9.t1
MVFLQVLLLVIFFLQLRGDLSLRPRDVATGVPLPTVPAPLPATPEELGRSLVEFFTFVGSFRWDCWVASVRTGCALPRLVKGRAWRVAPLCVEDPFETHLNTCRKAPSLYVTGSIQRMSCDAEAGNFPFCTIDPNMGKAKCLTKEPCTVLAPAVWRRLPADVSTSGQQGCGVWAAWRVLQISASQRARPIRPALRQRSQGAGRPFRGVFHERMERTLLTSANSPKGEEALESGRRATFDTAFCDEEERSMFMVECRSGKRRVTLGEAEVREYRVQMTQSRSF